MGDSNKIIVGSAAISLDGTDLGFTTGGVVMRDQKDFLDIEADQNAGIVKKHVTMERQFVQTTLLQATLENLRKAMMEPASNSTGSALNFGSASPAVQEHTLTLTGKGPDGNTRTWVWTRAIPHNDEVEHNVGMRDQVSSLPLSFECLKDDGTGQFGYVVDTA